ncbi:hypothetical protein PSHT_04148 [Puccinia striiformis]|uniref:Uncharacterized protein n=1 Tax=Puccinia striiformis TaxID=27350 RepID=A0A2S4WDZ2_9BASI|nr:hypothetical protein PSHT_04148 [Puccinia striiformis]
MWRQAISSLGEAAQVRLFSAKDKQDCTVVKILLNQNPSHKTSNIYCNFSHRQILLMNVLKNFNAPEP